MGLTPSVANLTLDEHLDTECRGSDTRRTSNAISHSPSSRTWGNMGAIDTESFKFPSAKD
jgi:hypothetical protein